MFGLSRGKNALPLRPTSWRRQEGAWTYWCDVDAFWVNCGHLASTTTDNAGRCTHEEFLEGQFQDSIRTDLGEEVLGEVIDAVTHAAEIPQFAQNWQVARRRAEAWRAVRLDVRLALIAADPDESGAINNRPSGDQVDLRNSLGILRLQNWEPTFRPDGSRRWLRSKVERLHPDALFVYRDHFYLACRNLLLAVLDPHGVPLPWTESVRAALGPGYSGGDLCRKGNRVILGYTDRYAFPSLPEAGDSGYLEVDLTGGIVSRCPTGRSL